MLLYTLVAGRGPFDDIVGVQRVLEAQIGQEPPPPSRFMEKPLAAPLEAVILRAIAKNPAERFADVTTFRRELGRAWTKERGSRRGSTASGRRRGKPDVHRPSFDRGATSYAHRPAFDRCHIRSCAASLPRAMYGAGCGETVTVRAFSAVRSEVQPQTALTPSPGDPSLIAADRDGGPSPRSTESWRPFRAPVSRRGVFCSAAAFFAVAGGLSMWFVR
jgi:hypothetical protein